MVNKINKNSIFKKINLKGIVRPLYYMIITFFISTCFLALGVDIFLISLSFTVLISICSYLGYYYPRNTSRRALLLLISSICILIEVWLASLTAIIEVEIENVGIVMIDLRSLFITPIILLSFNVFMKVINLFDSWKNER